MTLCLFCEDSSGGAGLAELEFPKEYIFFFSYIILFCVFEAACGDAELSMFPAACNDEPILFFVFCFLFFCFFVFCF